MMPRNKIDAKTDQLTLLLLLSELKQTGFQTKRLKLQKLVYMADLFGTILERKPTSYTFIVYQHGPFSKEIQSDIDRLVVIGDVKAERSESWNPEKDCSFKYQIEKSGAKKVNEISTWEEFEFKQKAIELAVLSAGHFSGESLRRLVYAEPNYLEAKRIAFKTVINPEYVLCLRFKEVCKRVAWEKYKLSLTGEEVAWIYFNFLKQMLLRPSVVELPWLKK